MLNPIELPNWSRISAGLTSRMATDYQNPDFREIVKLVKARGSLISSYRETKQQLTREQAGEKLQLPHRIIFYLENGLLANSDPKVKLYLLQIFPDLVHESEESDPYMELSIYQIGYAALLGMTESQLNYLESTAKTNAQEDEGFSF